MKKKRMNERFPGFPYRMQFTPLPNLFFSALLPRIDDLNELKVILHIFWLLYQKRGYPKFIAYKELLADRTLMQGIGNEAMPEEALRIALDKAAEQGVLLYLTLKEGAREDATYFLNTEANQAAIAKIRQGELSLGEIPPQGELYVKPEMADIFTLYEQNIGMLTPMLAEELKGAERLYPADWIQEAFREAVSLNKRNWRYIARILERWQTEGKEVGEPGGDLKKKETGPAKYFTGKYGHVVRR